MSSRSQKTSQKHRNFVSEPMRTKRVTELPGIGEKLGQRLENKGYDRADGVYAKYLTMRRDEGNFTKWVKQETNANHRQATDCYRSLSEWDNQFM